jgi:hypothetical protein
MLKKKCDLLPFVHFRFIKKKERSNRKKQLRPAEKNYVITTLPLHREGCLIKNCECFDSDSNYDFVIHLGR